MAANCFAAIAVQCAILNSVIRHNNPSSIHQHLHADRSCAVTCWPAVTIMAAGLSVTVYKGRVDVMGLRWPTYYR